MPNWSSNTIAVKGKKQNIINWLNKGLGNEKKLTANLDWVTIENILKESEISLDSFNPMPETFIEWDTTNDMENYSNWLSGGFHSHEKKNCPLLNSQEVWKTIKEAANKKYGSEEYDRDKFEKVAKEIYPEYLADYEKYCEGWKAAKKYQEETYGVVGWYDWGCKYRGTKWDAELEDWTIRVDGGEDYDSIFVFHCETAWSMPTAWLNKMQDENKDLLFFCRAIEEGDFYNGYFAVREEDWAYNGENLYEECKEEIARENDGLEETDEEAFEDKVWDLMSEKNSDITTEFYKFVEEYECEED